MKHADGDEVWDCDDFYPYYGLAPHYHTQGNIVGSTKINDRSEWPGFFY